jgi:hypothetical protein
MEAVSVSSGCSVFSTASGVGLGVWVLALVAVGSAAVGVLKLSHAPSSEIAASAVRVIKIVTIGECLLLISAFRF